MRFKSDTSSKKSSYIPLEKADLIDFKNCYISEGGIKGRKGIFANAEKSIFRVDNNTFFEMSFICTDCYLYLNGRFGRVAVSISDNLTDSTNYSMMLIYSDGEIENLGDINFTRVSFDQYGYPDSFTVFRGKPIKGCGIYFISRQVYDGDYPDFVRIMELSRNMDEWVMVLPSEIYVPTVLANGRGESYFFATYNEQFLKFPEPVMPESKNLINPTFKAYYSSDGSSSKFCLPYSNLDEGIIKCEFSYMANTYSWRINEGEVVSEPTDVEGTKVILGCDRETGKVYFQVSNGVYWIPPYTGKLNNLCFVADKSVEESRVKVASMSACCYLSGGSSEDSSEVTAFYNSSLYPSAVVTNSPENPLFFPQDAQFALGETEKTVEKMLLKDRNLIAFKEDEVYTAEITAYKGRGELVTRQGALKNTGVYPLKFKRSLSLQDKPLYKTITLVGDELLFLSEQGGVWKINTTASSYKNEKLLNTQNFSKDCFGVAYDGSYLLVNGNDAYIVQKSDKGYSLGKWTFPSKMIYGFSYLGQSVFLAEFFENDVYLIYPVLFEGKKDIKLKTNGFGIYSEEKSVEASFKVKLLESSYKSKKILRIRTDGKGEKICLNFYDGEKKLSSKKGLFKNERAYFNCAVFSVNPAVEFEFDSDTEVGGIAVEYRTLNKI